VSEPSTVIYRPDPKHHCNIGWELRELPPDHLGRSTGSTHYYVHAPNEPAGTIKQCNQCGRMWVAHDPQPYGGRMSAVTDWKPLPPPRPEGRIARWVRERRSRVVP